MSRTCVGRWHCPKGPWHEDSGAGARRGMTVALPSILPMVLFALNVPVAFAIAISALSFFSLADGLPIDIFFQKMVAATESYPLLAVPFFVLAGSLMNAAGITRRLLHL